MTTKIGMQLRQARMDKDLTLEQVSKKLFIRVPYLQALEDGNFDLIPTKVQLRGFLRSYSDYLELSTADILRELTPLNGPAVEEADQSPPSPTQVEKTGTQEPASLTDTIFAEIGHSLLTRREILGLSLEDIEAHTHIPVHYVKFLENGELDHFPSPTQARGMLSNYVSFLDLESSEIMLHYAEALQARLSARQDLLNQAEAQQKTVRVPKPSPLRLPPWFRMFFSPDTFLVGIIGIFVIGFIIWGIGRITRTQAQLEPIPTAPSLVEALLPTSTTSLEATNTPQVTPTLELLDVETGEEEPTQIPTVPVAGQTSVQVFIIVRQRAYLKVIADGETAYEGRVLSGESYTFTGQERIEVLTGNAAALQVFFNEQDMGVLGIFGEVANMIYTREGVVVPTALPTPTLSPEELATATPTPTPTPRRDDVNLPPSQNTPIP